MSAANIPLGATTVEADPFPWSGASSNLPAHVVGTGAEYIWLLNDGVAEDTYFPVTFTLDASGLPADAVITGLAIAAKGTAINGAPLGTSYVDSEAAIRLDFYDGQAAAWSNSVDSVIAMQDQTQTGVDLTHSPTFVGMTRAEASASRVRFQGYFNLTNSEANAEVRVNELAIVATYTSVSAGGDAAGPFKRTRRLPAVMRRGIGRL